MEGFDEGLVTAKYNDGVPTLQETPKRKRGRPRKGANLAQVADFAGVTVGVTVIEAAQPVPKKSTKTRKVSKKVAKKVIKRSKKYTGKPRGRKMSLAARLIRQGKKFIANLRK